MKYKNFEDKGDNMNDNYVIFYKTDKNSNWQSKRLDMPVEQWEGYCREQNYIQYEIRDLSTYDDIHLHLLTDIVHFNSRYYLPDEEIPYPDSEPNDIEKFDLFLNWEEENEFNDIDYDEVYNGEKLWTDIITNFSINKDMDELGIVSQIFIEDFPKFIEKLNQYNHAVYINEEYSPFKWLVWIKNDKVRIIHQDYRKISAKTEFDILVDKIWFFGFCDDWLTKMQEYADKDLKRYKEYIENKHPRF